MAVAVYTNNATATLSSSITAASTSLTVTSGQGALFPSTASGNYFYVTLIDTVGTVEIVKVTAKTTDTFTIVRAQDGTTASAFASGSKVELRIVAAGMNEKLAKTGDTATDLAITNLTVTNISLSGNVTTNSATISPAELSYLDGVTSNLQAQINTLSAASIPAGTKMLFAQTNAPTGWTKDTTHDNKALRVVSGTAASGGTVAFTSAFASRAVSGTVGGTTLTMDQMPIHNHTVGVRTITVDAGGSASFIIPDTTASNWGTSSMGGNQPHTHSFTAAIDMAVQYVDVIIATKN